MALINDMGVTGAGIHHPHHKNRWAVNFVGMNGGAEHVSHELRLQAITADRPKLEFEKIQLDRYNSRAYIAGKYTWQPISITFEADLGGQVALTLQAQLESQQRIIAPTAAPLLPATAYGNKYKFGLHLDLLDGESLISIERWFIEGCYFENVDFGDLDYSASETVKIVTTISYDHARMSQQSPYYGAKATGGAT